MILVLLDIVVQMGNAFKNVLDPALMVYATMVVQMDRNNVLIKSFFKLVLMSMGQDNLADL